MHASTARAPRSRACATAVIDEELHMGTVPTYAAAGLAEVSHPTKRRKVMRADFS